MESDRPIEEVAAQLDQPRERALFVGAGEPAIPGQDGLYIDAELCSLANLSVLLISTSRLTSSHSCKPGDDSAEN
jgi:hypothetical protein